MERRTPIGAGASASGVAAAGGPRWRFVRGSTNSRALLGPRRADPRGILELPAGSSCVVLQRSGDGMTDASRSRRARRDGLFPAA